MATTKGVWVHVTREDDLTLAFDSHGLMQFLRVPTVGEHFQIQLGGPIYEVMRVIHLPYGAADSDVEIFGRKVVLWDQADPIRSTQ